MLVLSRRQNDKVVFPNLGISVEILRITGNSVRLGVDAPPQVKVFRHEVAEKEGLVVRPDALQLPQKSLSHQLRNRLNTVTLAMGLVQKQLENGWIEEAERTLEKALADFSAIDREIGSATNSSGQSPQRRALLVEDDANESALLAGFLRASGIAVDSASDGYKAIDYLTTHDHPDVVLLDMQMPRCDGPTTLSAIRGNPELKGLRIYGVSGRQPGECGVDVGPDGVDCWFSKPLDPRTLVRHLDQAVRQTAAAS